MGYNQKLTDRIREMLAASHRQVEEKTMFNGICFMVDGKMCICVRDNEMMCRIGPDAYESALEKNGCRPMIHGGRLIKGFVFVAPEGYAGIKEFEDWIALALEFNTTAKSAKRKRPRTAGK